MSAGDAIVSSMRHRIRQAGAAFMGREVTIFTNASSPESAPLRMDPEMLWKTQPALRTVVDFVCRNVAQLGIHVFEHDGDERRRDRDSELARLVRRPNDFMSTYDLVYDLVGNLMLHNQAFWFIHTGRGGNREIHPFPAHWVTPKYENYWQVTYYAISPPNSDDVIEVPADQVLAFPGWNPNPGEESSPVETLRLILEEQHHARKHRVQVWRKNGRIGSYVTRPADASKWDNTNRSRFYKMLETFVGNEGSRAGGMPLLEDGMKIERVGFSSADEEWAESVKLSLETVAQVYQVNPTMVGVLDNANYSNVREFNRSLYTNTLGPLLRQVESRLNSFLPDMIGESGDERFIEFNVEEKLRGSFEEQASVMSTSIGGPWMTRNEGRHRLNMPPIEGGDELITPLNVTQGGQASPQDGGGPHGTPSDDEKLYAPLIKAHSERAERVVTAKGWFDRPRFNRELREDLSKSGLDPARAERINEELLRDHPDWKESA